MQKPTFIEAIEEIVLKDPRFDRDAYLFVREGLDFTVQMLKKNPQGPPALRHVTGQELLDGLRRHALEQFGPMSKTVLEEWGIKQCEDFGEIVFNMVERGILGKTERDSRDDFKGGYSFDEAFVKPYRPAHRRARSTPSTGRSRTSESKKLSNSSN
ncbi:MAG: hypothetical protein FJ395_04915 [Verrucomicrobia bacterium]|nr:hypothetical protein [Verrucomicrobiota bacterium]